MASQSFTEKLLAAKVPQLLGTYLAVGFGLLQFVEFVVNRYSFDSGWVDRYLLIWLGIIPAVALLIYYRGLPNREISTGSGWKTGLIFTNIGIICLLVFLLGSGGVAASTEQVNFVDADGNREERVIPARSAVQRIAVFEFQNGSGTDDWWGSAFSLLLNEHLRQRPELINVNPVELVSGYDRFGATPFGDINVATQRKIAQRAKTDYFISADYEVSPQGYSVKGNLHRSRDGKSVQPLEAAAENVYDVIDRLKEQIDDYLPPLGDLDEVETELPSSALITDKIDALESYTKGLMLFNTQPDKPAAAETYFRQSVRQDPSCAACSYALGLSGYLQGKSDSARILFRDALRLAEVLPEREQFLYKTMLVSANNDVEGTVKILEAFKTVYPYDWYPYQMLESFYGLTYGTDSVIALLNEAAELSNRERALERLYDLYSREENFPEVERVIKELDAEFPDEDKSLIRRARLYRKTGRADEAREVLEEMMMLDPLNPEPGTQLINLEMGAGNYTKAERLTKKLMRQASTATDSSGLWRRLIGIYAEQGKVAEAKREMQQYEAFAGRRNPRMVVLMQNLNNKIQLSILSQDYDYVDRSIAELSAFDANQGQTFTCLMPFNYSIFGVERPGLAEQFADCKPTLAALGPMVANLTKMTELLLAKDYPAAADLIDTLQEESVDLGDKAIYARINRLAERPERAREFLEAELVSRPRDPRLHLELARLERDAGNVAAAQASLDIVQAAYVNADENFVLAAEAQKLAAELAAES